MDKLCGNCEKNILECDCPLEGKIRMQMFFEDGTCSRFLRLPASWIDNKHALAEVRDLLLKSCKKKEGKMLVWGSGHIMLL